MKNLLSSQTVVVLLLVVIALHVRASFEYDGYAKKRVLTKAAESNA